MRKMNFILMLLAAIAIQVFMACERRPLEDDLHASALIPVKIDWSGSNIPVIDASGNGYVHRVSLRFFPKDGSAPFERYLEANVIEGEIEVPIGDYSVVVMNESVTDVYWTNSIYFTDVNSYSDFAAHIVADDATNYPFYTPLPNENLIVEPFHLASWSLDDFTVTKEMVTRTRSVTRSVFSADEMANALTKVKMRPLTYTVKVFVNVENLCSAQLIQGAMRGFAQQVYMASAQTTMVPATHIFRLNSRKWTDTEQKNGTVEKEFLSFGRLPQSSDYWVNLDVVYTNGEFHETPLLFDVSNQVNSQPQTNVRINIDLNIALPLIEGGIHVGEWDDQTITIQ